MKDHLVVFFCYKLVDFHKKSFENLSQLNADFFIVENPSKSSKEIENYFLSLNDSKIIGYIRYNKNTANIGTFFIRDFFEILSSYKFVTFTDGDLVFDNVHEMKNEVFKNLSYSDVLISAVDFKLDNLPKVKGAEQWVPRGCINYERNYNEQYTGIHFMTLRSLDLHILKDIRFADYIIAKKVYSIRKKWVKTITNKAYHLTWDIYTNGNSYYEYKKTLPGIWDFNLNEDQYIRIL